MQDHPIILDTSQNGIQQTLTSFYCGDSGEKRFCITLMHQNSVYTPQTGILAMCGKKPDGTHFLHPCTVSGSQVYYLPTAQTFATPGTVECQLIVYGENGSVLYAPRFAIEVEEPLEPYEGLVSADEWTLLPVHVLTGLSAADSTLMLDGKLVGAVALAETYDSLPTGVCGQFAFVQTGDAGHASGFYRFGTQWEHLSVAEHAHTNLETLEQLTASHIHTHANKTALDSVTADVVLNSHTHANAAALAQVEAANLHSHANKTVLDKFSEANGVPQYNGNSIGGEAPDTLETLELNTAYDTLLVRPDWADAPVYNITSNETVAELCDSGDHIVRLTYLVDELTGMPCPELYIRTGGVSYVCLSATYHDIGSVTRQAGWYTVDDMEYLGTTPPTITNMTFTTLEVATDSGMPDAYTSLSSLPAKAQCALETLCRMVNVSVDAMGGLGVVENSVQRLTNAPQFGGQYAFTAAQDITLPLPSTTFVTGEASFTIDLHCTQNITLNIPRDLLRSGGRNPDTRQGYHRLTFRYEHNAGKFSVEETAQVVPQYWDDIPDTVIPLEQCTWAQIKSIGQHGYLNSVSQWCILRNGTEEVWFEIGDTKTLTLTNGTVLPLVILGFRHDDVWDGSGKAPFTFGMANNGTTAMYVMNQTATNNGGWEDSYMRRVTMQSFLNVFPSDLRNVVATVNKKTALSSDVTSVTQDAVWIQSKEELSGQSDVRYAYYLSHRFEVGPYTSWLRDPVPASNEQFYLVSSGGITSGSSNGALCVMICFCV